MEIERKFLIRELPDHLDHYPHDLIRQAYVSTDPVIRIRQIGDQYILTIKGSGLLVREEVEFPLSAESFAHLMTKTEGIVIEKLRYRIPGGNHLLIEMDVFGGAYEGFIMAEVEFSDLDQSKEYIPPSWFGPEVTKNPDFHNSSLSTRTPAQVREFMDDLRKQT